MCSSTSPLWLPENPARGQCNVTALAFYDRFGGEILKTPVESDWHFYNRVAGTTYDLSAEQFSVPPAYLDIPSDRDEALAGSSARALPSSRGGSPGGPWYTMTACRKWLVREHGRAGRPGAARRSP